MATLCSECDYVCAEGYYNDTSSGVCVQCVPLPQCTSTQQFTIGCTGTSPGRCSPCVTYGVAYTQSGYYYSQALSISQQVSRG